MIQSIPEPVTQTVIFSIIFIISLFLFKKQSNDGLSVEWTNQLKGLAILAIIFSHIGYFLFPNQRFLYPLSALAGVGVNLFLLLSGFGLTLSQLDKPLSTIQFYKKRLFTLYLPLWIVLISFYLLDFLSFTEFTRIIGS